MSPIQLHPKFIRYMASFYMVCILDGDQTRHSSLSDKNTTFLSPGIDKVSDWEGFYVFVDESCNRPFNFLLWVERQKAQINSANLNSDDFVQKLNKLFAKEAFNVPKLCECVSLLALWGFHPDTPLS